MMRNINIGGQGFDRIRENNYFYVDKTSFIREWWESGDDVTLITRPRRFGKTLNMNMLECFFSLGYAGRGELFQGLSIWKDDRYRAIQGTYPVIALSFANIKQTTYEEARAAVIIVIQDLFQKYMDLWEKDSDAEKIRYAFMNLSADASDAEVSGSLHRLTDYLYFRYRKKVLIFLDEYDTPLQEAFLNGYWDEMAAFIRSLFNSTFKTNPSMERAVMTGITRVSKESIFSDLNNLNVVTTSSSQYETSFGFTEEEVFDALEEFNIPDQKERVKAWYDGFTFGRKSDIYNPWSILNFLKKREYAPYWAHTSSNGLISYELRTADNWVKHQMEGLLNGSTVTSAIDEQVIFSQLTDDAEAIWSLFLASGYLKTVSRKFDGRKYFYTLALTNFEVEVMFEELIRGWFARAGESYSEFTAALARGDVESLNYYLNDILINVAGSFDTRKRAVPGHEMESFYHGLVLGLVATERDWLVTSNRESGLDRYDVLMKPRGDYSGNAANNMPAIIIEFKVFDPGREGRLEETADRALAQIRQKKYDATLIAEGVKVENIFLYGMAFRGKEALVKMERDA